VFRPYRVILARPGALVFSATGLLARLPMSMAGIGIVLLVVSKYDSYALAGRVSAAYVLTQAICSPRLARYVDRYGQARVMRPAIAVSTLALAALAVAASFELPVAWLYAAAVVTGATMGSFGSLVRARWSHAVAAPRELHTAYSLESALDEVVFVVGPVLATTLAASVDPVVALAVAVVSMTVGGYWFLSLRATQPPSVARPDGAPRTRSVMRSGGMIVLAFVFAAMGSIFGASDVSTVAFSREHGHPELAGVVLAVFALGSMISGLIYGARHWAAPLWRRFALGTVALALGVSLFVFVSSMQVLAAVMFVTGFAIAPTIINGNSLVRSFVPHARLTEGLALVGTMLGVGVSFGSSIAGVVIDAHGSRGGYLVVVGAALAVVGATAAALRTLRSGTTELTFEDAPTTAPRPTEPSEAELADAEPVA
jgi:MFS family permease